MGLFEKLEDFLDITDIKFKEHELEKAPNETQGKDFVGREM